MRLALLVVLLCLGCTSTPRQYERGTFAPPPPPTARPGVGLPTYDPHAKPLPPQPHPARVLPEDEHTRQGLGLWGSGSGAEEPSVEVEILEWPVSVPAPVLPELVAIHAKACADKAAGIAALMLPSKNYAQLTDADRACFTATLMARCLRARAERTLKTDETRERPNRTANLEALAAPVKWANALERACKPRQRAYKDMLTLVLENWR